MDISPRSDKPGLVQMASDDGGHLRGQEGVSNLLSLFATT